MLWYFVKLIILLPLVGGMAFGALWLWRKYQPGLIGAQGNRAIKLLEMLPMGSFGKTAGSKSGSGTALTTVPAGAPNSPSRIALA